MKLLKELLNESTKLSVKTLPKKFATGEGFMDFIYDTWPSRKTHVEHQGGGAWSAVIDGGGKIKGATYDAQNHYVSWLDKDFEELEEAVVSSEMRSKLAAALKIEKERAEKMQKTHERIFRPRSKEEQAKYDAFIKQQKEKWGKDFEAKMKDPNFKKEFDKKWSDFAKAEMDRPTPKDNWRGD